MTREGALVIKHRKERVVVISDEEINSLLKVEKVIDKFIEFYNLMESLTKKEQKMLIKSLELAEQEG